MDQGTFPPSPFQRAQSPEAQAHGPRACQSQHKTGRHVLEIGCGTGLLSFMLAPYVSSLVAADAAQGMVEALRAKLEAPSAPKNIAPLCVLLEDPEDPALPPQKPDAADGGAKQPRRKFDLIISHLCLHHMADLRAVLHTMLGCLRPGGSVALTDYEDFGPEARKFHPEAKMAGVERHGIPREGFAGLMREVGFEGVDVGVGWRMVKQVERVPGEWGQKKPSGKGLAEMEFPFLLCRGVRPG